MYQEAKQWIKARPQQTITFILFLLIASISFGLGYLSASEFRHSPIIIEQIQHEGFEQ
ncbi:MAG: hypothetical protein Q8P45_00315 [Candidatus Harrisonbacteria bacterium]|nr:hypothetical protein [Candidatus Harrisonbacteria bacterium]